MKNLSATLLLISTACLSPAATYGPSKVIPPKPVSEFRAAWVATVANIDWPSKKGLSTAEQKAELIAILDRAAQLKLNAIIFQVRPACDAMYQSSLEPWSEYLTGVEGQPPAPFYDPLAFAIEEAHQRGLELHAWFNPYRARHLSAKSPIPASHIMDVVKRYDIDGVHFDDYFYPYKESDDSGKEIDFPDESSWRRFGAGGKLTRDDWRRENVNTFIQHVYKSIKAAKPWVKFGISPFGIWRPHNPPQINGLDAYNNLYADSRKWLASGWVDYFAPQLYWSIDAPEQSFPVLLKWWAEQNRRGRHLWPGMDTTKTRGKWKPEEIVNQIRLARAQPGADGHIHWNMKSLMRGTDLDAALSRVVYSQPALIPASPSKPQLSVSDGEHGSHLKINWTSSANQSAWLWLLQMRIGGQWQTEILPANKTSQPCNGTPPDVIAISAIDRNGNASPAAVLEMK